MATRRKNGHAKDVDNTRDQNDIVEKEAFVVCPFLPFTAKCNILQKRACNNFKKEKKRKVLRLLFLKSLKSEQLLFTR